MPVRAQPGAYGLPSSPLPLLKVATSAAFEYRRGQEGSRLLMPPSVFGLPNGRITLPWYNPAPVPVATVKGLLGSIPIYPKPGTDVIIQTPAQPWSGSSTVGIVNDTSAINVFTTYVAGTIFRFKMPNDADNGVYPYAYPDGSLGVQPPGGFVSYIPAKRPVMKTQMWQLPPPSDGTAHILLGNDLIYPIDGSIIEFTCWDWVGGAGGNLGLASASYSINVNFAYPSGPYPARAVKVAPGGGQVQGLHPYSFPVRAGGPIMGLISWMQFPK